MWAQPHHTPVPRLRHLPPHWMVCIPGATWPTALRVMTQGGREEPYFPSTGTKREDMSGNFSKVGRRCSPSGFINNDIPSSGVIQNVKHRQNFKGKKRGLSGGEKKEGEGCWLRQPPLAMFTLLFPGRAGLQRPGKAGQETVAKQVSVPETYGQIQRLFTFINPNLDILFHKNMVLNRCG